MALQYTFLENDPLNSAVVTSAGEPAYTVSTPWRLVNRTTTVTVASGAVLATIEWHWFTPPIFVLRGEQVDMQQWLRRVSPFDLCVLVCFGEVEVAHGWSQDDGIPGS
jgi:hypothetical protein